MLKGIPERLKELLSRRVAILLLTNIIKRRIIVLNLNRGSRLTTLIVAMCGLILASNAFADDEDDVLAIVYQYGDLENDLEAQAKLMRSDRVVGLPVSLA